MREIDWVGKWPYGKIEFTGQDNNSADFDVYSMSRRGLIFDVRIDYHAGCIKCDCEDASYRKERRTAPIGVYMGIGCKHIQRVCALCEIVGVFKEGE
jgi:hypothetical protein